MNTGQIVNLVSRRSGSVTVLASSAGSSTLTLDSVLDFHDLGGFVLINGAAFAYTGRNIVLGTITMSAPLAANVAKGVEILIFPVAIEKWAMVQMDGGYPEDALWCRVPHNLAAVLAADGQRALSRQEKVEYTISDNQHVITNVLSKLPELQPDAVPDGFITETMVGPDSITTPALAANTVAAIHMQADSVGTEALSATAIDGMTITGALFRTAASGARIEITTDGLLQYDAVGTLLTRIGATGTGNKFSGSFEAEDIRVLDGLELFGQNNYFGPNSKVTLRSGQGGSTSAPTVSTTYKEQDITGYMRAGFRPLMGYHKESAAEYGVAGFFDDSKLMVDNKYYELGQITVPQTNGGAPVVKYRPGGYVRIQTSAGPRAVVLTEFADTSPFVSGTNRPVYTRIFNDTAMNTSGTVAPTDVSATGKYWHAFSFNRSTVIGRCFNVDPVFGARHYTMASIDRGTGGDWLEFYRVEVVGDTSTNVNLSKTGFNFAPYRLNPDEALVGVTFGSGAALKLNTDTGTEYWVINTTHQNIVLDWTGSTRISSLEWPVLPGTAHRVYAHGTVSTNTCDYFAVLNNSNNYDQPVQKLTKYSNWSWSGASLPLWFNFAWRGHSTKSPEWLTSPSPMASLAPVKRSWASVSIPPLPPPEAGQNSPRDINKDVYGWVLYMGYAGAPPVNTGMFRQSTSPTGDPVTSFNLQLDGNYTLSGANPVTATTGFPALSPAKIISSASSGGNPYLEIDGDGNIKSKTLAVNGVVFPSTIPARVTTLETNGVYTSWTPIARGGSFVFTSYSSVGVYNIIGQMVNFSARITIANVGAAAGDYLLMYLPVPDFNLGIATMGTGRESAVTGTQMQVRIDNNGSNYALCFTYNNVGNCQTGYTYLISGSYMKA